MRVVRRPAFEAGSLPAAIQRQMVVRLTPRSSAAWEIVQ
jgi:hypothetical protein